MHSAVFLSVVAVPCKATHCRAWLDVLFAFVLVFVTPIKATHLPALLLPVCF